MNIDLLYSKFLTLNKISTDTRKDIKGSIFFCLKGPNYNGNQFAHEALKKGAEIIIIDEKQKRNKSKFVLVDSALKCLQNLAKKHREKLKIPVLAITGTNGKTSTKNLIFDVLNKEFKVKKTIGNLNNHIGLPLSILSINKSYDFAVLEFGASKLGDIAELCEIGKPNYGLITNVGRAHLEGFKTVQNIIKTKTELWEYLIQNNGVIFLNMEDDFLLKTFSKKKTFSTYKNTINYGIKYNKIKLLSASPFLEFKWKKKLIKTKIIGDYNLNNIITSIAVAEYFQVNEKSIQNTFQNNSFNNNRSELIKTKKNKIILDAYNANPSSMECSIKSFINIESKMPKTLIIGDMLELGESSQNLHQELVEFLKTQKLKTCILVGEIFNEINCDFLKFKTTKSLEDFLKTNPIEKHLILIKGSRSLKLENIKKNL